MEVGKLERENLVRTFGVLCNHMRAAHPRCSEQARIIIYHSEKYKSCHHGLVEVAMAQSLA
jgi:hypothetical protein